MGCRESRSRAGSARRPDYTPPARPSNFLPLSRPINPCLKQRQKRGIHEDTRRTTKTHEARRREEPEPFRAPDTPSRSPVLLSDDPLRRQGRGLPAVMLQKAPCFLIFDSHRCTGCTGFFSGNDWPLFPGIRNPAPVIAEVSFPCKERPVLLILCILYIDVQWLVFPDGSARLLRPQWSTCRCGMPLSKNMCFSPVSSRMGP